MEAFKNAGIDEAFLEANEVGVLYGNDSSTAPIINAVDIIREKKNTVLVGSGSIFQSMNSTVSMNLSVIFKLRGVNFTISGACASGSHAIGMGYLLIKSGLQDCILCGGAQEVNPFSVGSFDGLSAFSNRETEPQKASRPFDKSRDGLVPSGGGASLVLESYESAVKRGAPILAEIIGYGFSSNGDHISVPNIDGPKRSLEMAIRNAGIALDEIKYINAHATSTPIGDLNEAKAIAEVFEGHRPCMAKDMSKQKAVAKHLYMKGTPIMQIVELTGVTRQSVSRWVNQENWKEERAAREMSKESITSMTLSKLGEAIENTDADEKSNT